MKAKIAIIRWMDSTYYKHDYASTDSEDMEYLAPGELYSCGFLIKEDDEFVAICQDMEIKGKAARMILVIPKISIIEMALTDVEIEAEEEKPKKETKKKSTKK